MFYLFSCFKLQTKYELASRNVNKNLAKSFARVHTSEMAYHGTLVTEKYLAKRGIFFKPKKN